MILTGHSGARADTVNDPDYWRSRAEEMRTFAQDVDDADARMMMLRIASDLDRLAMRAEDRRSGRKPQRAGRHP